MDGESCTFINRSGNNPKSSKKRKSRTGKSRMLGIKVVINIPRNKAIILRRNKREKANNNGICKLCKGKKARKKPSVLATAPACPVTGANNDRITHLNTRFN